MSEPVVLVPLDGSEQKLGDAIGGKGAWRSRASGFTHLQVGAI
ncbi:MAG: hypothetical protein ACM3JD_09305 [Rudaea sp.]